MLIAIDHGNKQMKTVCRTPFVSGLVESTTKPFGSDILMYQNRYYTLSNQRIPYKRDKTEDDRFFILTLFGIAQELQARGIYGENTQRIQLAVGLPPAHYGAQNFYTNQLAKQGVFSYHSICRWCRSLTSGTRSRIRQAHWCVRERTNCRRCCSFSFFSFHKNYIGMAWDGQEGNVLHPTARSYR